jgi:bifunctional non-homologous end joining protein LigD
MVGLPRVKQPMLATLIDAPFDDDAWSFETKWDGIRALCAITERGLKLTSRTGHNLLVQFAELESIRSSFRHLPVLVDGEICSIDAHGRSDFQRLQEHKGRIVYVVFDLLAADGRDLRKHPLKERQRLLAEVARNGAHVHISKPVVRRGIALFARAKARGLEGIIGKRRDSRYVERRSRDWVKIKALSEQEAVIVGWTDPRRTREHFGALLLGVYEHGKLEYAGKVGTGFDAATLADVSRKLRPLATDRKPVVDEVSEAHVHWVKPRLVAELKFGEWTRDGRMRQPVFLGLRTDKKPREVVRELPTKAVSKRS